MKLNEPESMYKYGQMLFIGEGIKINKKESFKYFQKSKELGFEKSGYFLTSFDKLNNIRKFSELPAETQLIFITNNIKNILNDQINNETESEFNQILLQPRKTEKLFFNKSLKSSKFYECLKQYKNILIEIEYPSASFKSIIDLVIKIRKTYFQQMSIGVVFSSFKEHFSKKCFSEDISYHRIGSSVRTIPSETFKDCTLLRKISIPSSITKIEENVFFNGIKSLEIIGNIQIIFHSMFNNCSSLTQIIIPPSITKIEPFAFNKCSSLVQIEIPFSVAQIGLCAFHECRSLTGIRIPSFVTVIENYVFAECSSLTQITIPPSVTKIKNNAFEGCSSLTQITIPSSVTEIGNSVFNGFKSLEINGDIQTIYDSMFNKCSSLVKITIPSSVTKIGDNTFYKCSSLVQVTIPSSVTSIGDNAFYECSSLVQVTIPSSVTSIGDSAFTGCSSLTQITILSSVISIGDYAFSGCSSLTQITIPSSVTKIGSAIFTGTKLDNIQVIPCQEERLKLFEDNMLLFKSDLSNEDYDTLLLVKSNIETLIVPQFIKKIDCYALKNCSSLTKISIPSSITEIEQRTFSELKSIEIIGNIEKIFSYMFCFCSSLTKITIPSSVTEIGDNSFYGCSSLAKIEIPSSVTKIGNESFAGCSSLTQIEIPSSVTKIGAKAFSFCSSLIQIAIPSSVTESEEGILQGCSKLEEIIIHQDKETRFEFFENKLLLYKANSTDENFDILIWVKPNIDKLALPSFIKRIGSSSFEGCLSLTQIIIPSSVTEIGDYVHY